MVPLGHSVHDVAHGGEETSAYLPIAPVAVVGWIWGDVGDGVDIDDGVDGVGASFSGDVCG